MALPLLASNMRITEVKNSIRQRKPRKENIDDVKLPIQKSGIFKKYNVPKLCPPVKIEVI